MRIQTRDHSNVMLVLKRALRDTKDACEVLVVTVIARAHVSLLFRL
jgi:hypothetical protein